ncbi:MAG: hypothetical protein IPP15_05350 [Saprospiraceae bacterium]|uniref:Uncharacterized protein n=1 Tax=Candidatus Opimibacter skivensis TaxID=2982028 RepID=A0A9D7ST75_9BACT|nr:hypothetical protein [Candidatus Opimibacter skivensis]
MSRHNIILKGTTHLLLGVILYMHVCSAWCAVFSGSCSEMNGQSHKSSYSHKTKSNGKAGDCQDYHLCFFNAAGQFSSGKNVEILNVFPTLAVEIPTLLFTIENVAGRNPVAFNNYHPPPPIADIRIFIQSFQI